jgi:hypothetical protein
MIYYHDEKIFAARKGPFKLYFYRNNPLGYPEKIEKISPELFNLNHDPSEQYNVADSHADIVKDIGELVERHRASVKPAATQLDKRLVATESKE